MSATEMIIYCVLFLGSMGLILFSLAGMKDDMPPLAFDDTITIETQGHTDAWIEANSDPIPGDDSDFHPDAGYLWIPEEDGGCGHGWPNDGGCGLCADADETEAMRYHVEVVEGELVAEEVTEFHPLKVVSDELGDWIPEAHTLATPLYFNDVLTARVRWGLIETFDTQLELTAA